jgi:signal transduction histidine kinase
MHPDELFRRYQDLQSYVAWNEADLRRVRLAAPVTEPHFKALIDDFYDEIQRHPDAVRVIQGGSAQIERLKGSLAHWIRGLFFDDYDLDYVLRRWRVGLRHVEIRLDQTYTNVALSRLRSGLLRALKSDWKGELGELSAVEQSLNKLLDLDLAIIELAYQTEFQRRQKQSERLATIGQVAGGISHEIRNPLNVIKTSVYYILNAKNASPEKIKKHLERIERQVGIADQVVTALNDFARLPTPDFQPVVVEPFLREVIELNLAGDAVQTVIECAETIAPILGDAQQLRIVFGNLVRNAHDAMPNGGNLTIRASNQGGNLAIAIADTGHGITNENLARIMEPLFSTKARGIGLGLAITRAIVEKHSGKIHVESQLGRGSTFTVVLPCRDSGNH